MEPEEARANLTRARERVESALRGGAPAGSDAQDEDADPASGLVGTEVDDALAESLNEELAAIERAEQRLSEGTYGRSIVSGDPIPDARLAAAPHAERTIEEQAQFEQGL